MPASVLDSAIAQADWRAKREGRDMTVYHVKGPDKWGRSAVFYVRPTDGSEGGAPEDSETVHQTVLP